MRLSFYTINNKYCDFLREKDSNVPYNMNQKAKRPFVGVVFKINDFNYYAPLSSPKQKHRQMKNQIDFIKIKGGKLGAVNFNNMIPVPIECLVKVQIRINNDDTKETVNYKNLLNNQLTWCNQNKEKIVFQAKKLYEIITESKGREALCKRCCNFKLDEKRLSEFIKSQENYFKKKSN